MSKKKNTKQLAGDVVIAGVPFKEGQGVDELDARVQDKLAALGLLKANAKTDPENDK